MSTKRIVSILIAVANAIIFVSLFLPYSGDLNILESLAPSSYIIIAYTIIGMLACILNKKVELNFLTSGTILAILITSLIMVLDGGGSLGNLSFGFYVFFIDALLLFIFTFMHGIVRGGRGVTTTAVMGTSSTGGVVQQTNSLNMNMPVNNYQSLPVSKKEKKKAPMDMLMGAPQQQAPNTVQSHMTELGLQSINISQDNLTGIDPNAAQVVQAVPAQAMPQQPVAQQQVVQQAMPVQSVPAQPPVAPQPGGRPDLLAGSQMSGQMDNSPFNPVPPQGPGQFL